MYGIPSIFVMCSAAALIAIVGFFVVQRVLKPINMDQHQGFLDAMLSIVGTLVSILLGLLVAAALDRYQTLEQNIDNESASVAQVGRLSWGFGATPMAKRLRALCIRYCDEVVNDDWPDMAQGHASQKVYETYAQLIGTVVNLHPANNGETNLHQCLLTAVQQIGDGRRQRILVLHKTWTHHLMPMLIICSLIVLVFAYLYAKQGNYWHGVLICLVAIALGGNLGLVMLLSNPFAGEFKIAPVGFELNARLMHEIESRPDLQKNLSDQNYSRVTGVHFAIIFSK